MRRAVSASNAAAAHEPTPLPAWANAENRALQQRIERAALQLKDANTRVEDDSARADAMRQALHLLDMQLRSCQVWLHALVVHPQRRLVSVTGSKDYR